jgi:hypothetical protein
MIPLEMEYLACLCAGHFAELPAVKLLNHLSS